jgi:hypothetical protein
MSDTQPTPPDVQPTPRGYPGRGLIEGWVEFIKGPSGMMAGLMALLALVGTGITLADASWARSYWLALVPVYGALCVFAAWYRHGQFSGTVLRQILHWLSVAAVIALDFTLLRRGEQASTGAGLSSLLILALGSLLAGIHLEWLFALVGLLLLAIFAVVSFAQQYVTLAFLFAAAAGLFLAAYWAMKR